MLPSFARFMALWIKRLGRCLVAKHRSLHHQHEQDLIVYRNGHRNLLNRILHWVCIPMETATSLLVLDRLILLSRLSYQERGRNAPPLPRTWKYLLQSEVAQTINGIMGLVSILAAVPPSRNTRPSGAWAAALFHAALAVSYIPNQQQQQSTNIIFCSWEHVLALWIASWLLQIGVGHWILEGNHPTFFGTPTTTATGSDKSSNPHPSTGVSVLAVATSVMIAWKS